MTLRRQTMRKLVSKCERPQGVSLRRLVTLFLLMTIMTAIPCLGHPMGNFSINHYAGITIERDFVEVHYLLDIAEIPTFQEMQEAGFTAQIADPHLTAYIRSKSLDFARGLHVRVDGKEAKLRAVAQNVIFPEGAGGLPTMRLGFLYRANIAKACKAGGCQLRYEDTNFPG